MAKRPLEPDPDHTGGGKRTGQQRAYPLTGKAPWHQPGAFLFLLKTEPIWTLIKS